MWQMDRQKTEVWNNYLNMATTYLFLIILRIGLNTKKIFNCAMVTKPSGNGMQNFKNNNFLMNQVLWSYLSQKTFAYTDRKSLSLHSLMQKKCHLVLEWTNYSAKLHSESNHLQWGVKNHARMPSLYRGRSTHNKTELSIPTILAP